MTNITSSTQGFEQTQTLEAGGAVQAGSRLVEEHDWRIIDELQRYRQPLPLASAETLGLRVAGFAQTKRFDDLLDLHHVIFVILDSHGDFGFISLGVS
jgi:hypothetical protein